MWGGTASERKDGGPSGMAGAKVGRDLNYLNSRRNSEQIEMLNKNNLYF